MANNKGFTLVEVVAGLVLISIILLSFAQLFIQSNKTASHNNDKLVAIQLADAMMAQAQTNNPYPKLNPGENFQQYFKDVPKKIEMNGKTFMVEYSTSQNPTKYANSAYSEKDLNLVKVVVTVTLCDELPNGPVPDEQFACQGKIRGISEGYIYYE